MKSDTKMVIAFIMAKQAVGQRPRGCRILPVIGDVVARVARVARVAAARSKRDDHMMCYDCPRWLLARLRVVILRKWYCIRRAGWT